eukprot:m51a1_g1011 putative domain containing protein (750) ;mRNA; r:599658-603368
MSDPRAAELAEFLARELAVRRWIQDVLRVKLTGDTCEELRSGIVLCYLARAIDERCIPRIQENKSQPLRLKENVLFFLEACKDLGVPRIAMFHSPDLDQGKVVSVVECLASLADVAVRDHGFKIQLPAPGPFHAEAQAVELSEQRQKEILAQLAMRAPKAKKCVKMSAAVFKAQLSVISGGDPRVLEKCEKGVTRAQALWRGYLARKLLASLRRDQAYRDRVAQEILDTERAYVANLDTCISVFLEPFERESSGKKKPIVKEADIRLLFGNIRDIRDFNRSLLADIEARVALWSNSSCLGDVFLKINEFLGAYTSYVKNYTTALDVLNVLRKKKKFLKFVQACKSETNSLDVEAFLIMPVQRIPRYFLLLQEMQKHTQAHHPDHKNLCTALDSVKVVAASLNEKKRVAESVSKIFDIETTITNKHPHIMKTGRLFVKEGQFASKSGRDVMLYLFSDAIVSCKLERITSRLRFHDIFPLEAIDLVDAPVAASAEAGGESTHFSVKKGEKHALKLSAKNGYEKDDFVRTFRQAKEALIAEKNRKAAASPAPSSADAKPADEALCEMQTKAKVSNLEQAKTALEQEIRDIETEMGHCKEKEAKEVIKSRRTAKLEELMSVNAQLLRHERSISEMTGVRKPDSWHSATPPKTPPPSHSLTRCTSRMSTRVSLRRPKSAKLAKWSAANEEEGTINELGYPIVPFAKLAEAKGLPAPAELCLSHKEFVERFGTTRALYMPMPEKMKETLRKQAGL